MEEFNPPIPLFEGIRWIEHGICHQFRGIGRLWCTPKTGPWNKIELLPLIKKLSSGEKQNATKTTQCGI
jgi:hypothetical protein